MKTWINSLKINNSFKPHYSMNQHLRKVLFLFISLALSGCLVGPKYEPPNMTVPDAWVSTPEKSTASEPTQELQTLASWWTQFNDPVLTSLIERAIASNHDLKIAELRVKQARLARKAAVAALAPDLQTSGSYQKSQSYRKTPEGDTESVTSSQYRVGFDSTWELDLFGGNRRNIEAIDADLQASIESQRGVLISLTAEVARNYVELRTFQQQLSIVKQNLAAQEHSLSLTRQRFEAGFETNLSVTRGQAQVISINSQVPTLESSISQALYNLAVLLGKEPVALIDELNSDASIPLIPPTVPVGIPSDLLRNRPDIRQSEAQIHAATARIGVAVADLYPKFTISGSAGYSASAFTSWFNPVNLIMSLGSSIRWNVFDMGKTKATVEVKKLLAEEAVINYQKTVLTALQEVENALIASKKEQEHYQQLVDSVALNRTAVELATKLYTEGQSDFLSVLDAQRTLYSSEESLLQSTSAMSQNIIALYKAIGSGWNTHVALTQ